MTKRSPLHVALTSVTAATLLVTGVFAKTIGDYGLDGLEVLLVGSFAVLFAWIAFWCFVTVVGFAKLSSSKLAGGATSPVHDPSTEIPATALLLPIHNENAEDVFARARAMLESLEAAGHARSFELFVLSDSTDPDIWLREELSWAELRRTRALEPWVYYRRRALKFRKKSGNIADFCQRWGGRYRYMIVLDADSLMDGETMVELVRRMELAPRLGILQAPALPVMRHSLYARRAQFSSWMYGPALFAGLAACFGDDANFWGHNAIVRVRPFMAHCGLPALSGRPPLGGPFLSHDFVEAALMRRAGFEIRLAWDLALGSYEQPPTSLASAAARDRRWCQGNLQHLRLLFARGFSLGSRLHFATGVLFYATSAIWALFLCFYALQYERAAFSPSVLLASARLDGAMLAVLLVVGALLFAGKGLGVLWALRDRSQTEAYGGSLKLLASAGLETLLGILIAPISMVHHVVAMLSIVLGVSADWLGAPREESSTPLRDAWHAHGLISVAGGVLGALLLWRLPPLALRLSPIWVSLLLAVPLDAALSSTVLGTRLRARRWLLTPAETMPSAILERAAELTSQRQDGDASLAERFERFVRDPWLNELHVALLRSSGRRLRPRAVVEKIAARVSVEGLAGLSRKETLVLLSDTWAIRTLHERHFCAAARPPPEADGEASSSAPQGSAESTTEHGEAHPSTE